MGSLITDTNKSVNQIQKKILPSCDELLVQVGYFYFSGFEEIYEDLKNIKMNSLISFILMVDTIVLMLLVMEKILLRY